MTVFPSVTLKAALTTQPAAVPVWEDVSAYLMPRWSFRRGRTFEGDQFAPGSGSVLLDNETRIFDPTYTAGTYYGNLKRMRRFALQATWDGVPYDVFSAYAERWPQSWEGVAGRVAVPLVDGFAVLARFKINATYPEQLTSERINAVLDDALWGSGQGWVLDSAAYSILGTTTILAPVGDRSVGVGRSTIQAATLAGEVALGHLQDVEANEQGLLFMGKDGSVTFRDRHRRFKPPYNTSQATFGEAEGEFHYLVVEMPDDTPIYNDIQLQRTGGVLQTASDADSQADYYPITYQDTGLLLAEDNEVADQANWRLNNGKQPAPRIASITIDPAGNPDGIWPVLLGLEIGDRVTVKRQPFGVGDPISQESWIEGIEHSVGESEWRVKLWLSPADTAVYWILDDTVASVLGTTTRLAY